MKIRTNKGERSPFTIKLVAFAIALIFAPVAASAQTQTITSRQISDNSILNVDINSAANISTTKLAEGADFLQRDSAVTWTAAQNAGGLKLTNLGAPTDATDAANKSYVDNATQQTFAGNGLIISAGTTIDFVSGDASLSVNPDNATVARDGAGAIGLASGLKVNTDNTSVEISSNALRIASGAGGAGLTVSAGVIAVGAGAGITVNSDNVTVNSATVLFKADNVFNEVPNESPDNSTTAFTVDNTIFGNTANVSINGLDQRPTTDFSVSGATITFTTAPMSGDSILVDYMK